MLIPSRRHTAKDLELWGELEGADLAYANTGTILAEKEIVAVDAIACFVADGQCSASVSWGKDSTVLADLVTKLPKRIPLAWIRVEPIRNPDCFAVRDEFLKIHPSVDYHEFEVWCSRDSSGWHATKTLERGIAEIERRWGKRHITGIRGAESFGRSIRMKKFGHSSPNGCAPIGYWSLADVMAYLAVKKLPVHPAYAMLGGGRYPRDRLRVASLGGRRGDGAGRAEWEREYYGDVLRRLEAG